MVARAQGAQKKHTYCVQVNRAKPTKKLHLCTSVSMNRHALYLLFESCCRRGTVHSGIYGTRIKLYGKIQKHL